MNLQDITTQLLYTTVPIWVEQADGSAATGTAFFYNVPVAAKPGQFIPLLITNHHVIANSKRSVIEVLEKDGELPSKDRRVRVELPGAAQIEWKSSELDLAAIPVGPVFGELQKVNRTVFFRAIGPELIPPQSTIDDLSALEEIVFIGYPSGLRDHMNATPLIRRGITATPVWNDFEGSPSFLVDAGVFPGSSGSPVFILNQGAYATRQGLSVGNRLIFLGVITATVLRSNTKSEVFLGLGKAVKSTAFQNWISGKIALLPPVA